MLKLFFSVNLGWVPPFGREDPRGIILPAVTLGWFYAAANLRLIRSAMLDVLDSEYIKLARAKGVSSQNVIVKHALRNAIIPALTFAGVTLGALVTGSLVVRLARLGQARRGCPVRPRLCRASGSGNRIHPFVCGRLLHGGCPLRIRRPAYPFHLGLRSKV